MDTWTERTKKFLKAAHWVTDEDAPAVSTLEHCATELDSEFKAATAQQYGLAHRYIMSRKPAEEAPAEQDEDLTFS